MRRPRLALLAVLVAFSVPVVVLHRHVPDSFAVHMAVVVTLAWVMWMTAESDRRRSPAALLGVGFVVGSIAFAIVDHRDRVAAGLQREVALERELERASQTPRGPDLDRWSARAELGDPLAIARIAGRVRRREPGWSRADRTLTRLGLGAPVLVPVDAGRAARVLRSSWWAAIEDGGTLGAIHRRDRLHAELEKRHRARCRELARRGLERVGATFPWTILASGEPLPWSLFAAWVDHLESRGALVEAALVLDHAGHEIHARLLLRCALSRARIDHDDEGAVIARLWLATLDGRAWWQPRIDRRGSVLTIAPADLGFPATPWARAVVTALGAHVEATGIASLRRPPELARRLRDALAGCLVELSARFAEPEAAARPEAVLLLELAALLAARVHVVDQGWTDRWRAPPSVLELTGRLAEIRPASPVLRIAPLLAREEARWTHETTGPATAGR